MMHDIIILHYLMSNKRNVYKCNNSIVMARGDENNDKGTIWQLGVLQGSFSDWNTGYDSGFNSKPGVTY